MRNNTTVALTLWSMLALAGCATTDDVLFVTKTSIGIDFDSKPASASIAYDRTEGYIAPRYDNGEIPPVVASIKSDASIFSPKIRQVYATGDAAVITVSKCPRVTLAALDPKASTDTKDTKDTDENDCPKVTPPTTPYTQKKLQGNKKAMFFGTTTTTGLKVGFTTTVPDSFVFGYKRKEYSFIPLGTVRIYEAKVEKVNGTVCKPICASWNEEKEKEEAVTGVKGCSCVFKEEYDVYPSVLASIDTAANAGTSNDDTSETAATETVTPSGDTSLSHSQFFATGRAARELAANPLISAAFKSRATEATESLRSKQEKQVEEQKEADDQLNLLFTDIESRFDEAGPAKKKDIVKLANKTLINTHNPESDLGNENFLDDLKEFAEDNTYRLDDNKEPEMVDGKKVRVDKKEKIVELTTLKKNIDNLPSQPE